MTTTTVAKTKRTIKPRAASAKKLAEAVGVEIEEADVKPAKPIYRTYEDFDYTKLLNYGGLDTYVNYKLLQKLHPRTTKNERMMEVKDGVKKVAIVRSAFDLVHEVYMPIQDFILDLEFNGFKYDIEGNYKMRAQGNEDCARMTDEIYSAVGKRVDLNSDAALGQFLYEELNLPVLSYSKGGAPSTDGETFRKLYKATGHEWLKTLGRYKEVNGSMNTFVRNYVEDFVCSDGRIHPSYNIVGTSSARLTGEDPNLTQLPNARNGYNLRTNYIVDTGNVFIAADFSSAEVKLLGALSRDPMLLKCIELNYDFHSFSASLMMGVPYDEFVAIRKDEDHPRHHEFEEFRRKSKALTFE